MSRVVVDVSLKPEIADPQGQAIAGACHRLGFDHVISVRQGKRFEIEIDAPLDAEGLAQVRRIAETLLANPVIEDYDVAVD